jgi:hypothetical protein
MKLRLREWKAPVLGQQGLGRFVDAAVIVTGGAHGIGRACAARLAEEGAHIVVADLDPSPLWAANPTRPRRQESAPSRSTLRPVWLPMASG